MHLYTTEPQPIRVLKGTNSTLKNSVEANHRFSVTFIAPVFISSCGELTRSGLGGAEHAGVILLLKSTQGQSLYVEVEHVAKAPEVIRVSSGSITGDMEKAVNRSIMPKDLRRNRSEVRILRVPAMHLSAVWRHIPAKPNASRVVPYTPNFAGVEKGRAYSARRADSILRNSAIQIILRWYERYEKDLSTSQPTRPRPKVGRTGRNSRGVKATGAWVSS
jgi:hypothetical protein